jgi:hypothetical protein
LSPSLCSRRCRKRVAACCFAFPLSR